MKNMKINLHLYLCLLFLYEKLRRYFIYLKSIIITYSLCGEKKVTETINCFTIIDF